MNQPLPDPRPVGRETSPIRPTAASPRNRRGSWPILVAALVGGTYALGHLTWFIATPLGRVPVLDEREILEMAKSIATGALPAEPFYRAPGYPLILATLRAAGVSAAALFPAALLLGAFLHAANSALAASVARTWFGIRSAAVVGALFALNPVFVYFAVKVTDATPALTCFLAGLACIAPQFTSERASAMRLLATSTLWASATAIRPNYLLVWLVLPALALRHVFLRRRTAPAATGGTADAAANGNSVGEAAAEQDSAARRGAPTRAESPEEPKRAVQPHPAHLPGTSPASPRKFPAETPAIRLLLASAAGAFVFAAVAAWQARVCGSPGFLPAQGAYNLWAANRPDANGRYYTQKLSLPPAVALQNPARAESLILYERATGTTPASLGQVNAYWRSRFIEYVTHHPLDWLGLLGRKLYALANDWEQYNNETPVFQIARSPWLRWNPISWGALFVLAVAGGARIASESRDLAVPLAAIATACAASALLFYVSSRFRLPLAAMTTIVAGVALGSPGFWVAWARPRQRALASGCILAAALAFSRFGDVRDTGTYVQDHALLARAAAAVGDDGLAWTQSEAALAMRPHHPDALRLAVASYFNLLLAGQARAGQEPAWRAAATRFLDTPVVKADDLRAVAALALWRAGDASAAIMEWRRLGRNSSAIAARWLAHDPGVTSADLEAVTGRDSTAPLVRIAATLVETHGPRALDPADTQIARRTAARLFRISADAPPSAGARTNVQGDAPRLENSNRR